MKKDMKILQLVCSSIIVFFLFIFMVVLAFSDVLWGEISGFGRRNDATYLLKDDPEGFWLNVVLWGGLFLFLLCGGVKGIVDAIRDIKKL